MPKIFSAVFVWWYSCYSQPHWCGLPDENKIRCNCYFLFQKGSTANKIRTKTIYSYKNLYIPVNKSIISVSRTITFSFWRVCKFISGKISLMDPASFLVFKILTYYYQNKLIEKNRTTPIYCVRVCLWKFVFNASLQFWGFEEEMLALFKLSQWVQGNHC